MYRHVGIRESCLAALVMKVDQTQLQLSLELSRMKRVNTRVEKDSMGEMRVPANALYGASTQRALENFPISDLRLPPEFVISLALIKLCAAEVNSELGLLTRSKARAISRAAREIVKGQWSDQFPVDVFQTGSGTSTNVNMNEVLARRARLILRADPDDRDYLHPNDAVNLCQSSNDVIPTAMHLSALEMILNELLPALSKLEAALLDKADEFNSLVKSGRTHHQDATPITLGQEFSGYAAQIESARAAIKQSAEGLRSLAIGGTAVGTGVNSAEGFGKLMAEKLSRELGFEVVESPNHFRSQASIDDVVNVSGSLRMLALALIKMINDLRWMSSGPSDGLGEIRLPSVQPGSSIMPGKVNPVILESAHMVAIHVLGLDSGIAFAGQSGNFELNTTLPLVAHNLLQAIKLLARSAENVAEKCILGIEAKPDGLKGVHSNNALVTALAPVLGYDKAALIAKSVVESGDTVLAVAERETDIPASELQALLNPLSLTKAGNISRKQVKKRRKEPGMKKERKRGFRVGDRVEILGYKTAISWGDRKPQCYGFIVNIDGAYIQVRPRWWPEGDVIERYPNELKAA